MNPTTIDQAYETCLRMARQHYENFPVASWVLPSELRKPIAAIYAFARTADDFADEGDLSVAERLAKLARYRTQLNQAAGGHKLTDPIFIALQDTLKQFDLPVQLLHDLITAFEMDVATKRYATYTDLLFYCRHSANPIGRLILHLTGNAHSQNLHESDAICSALQLINFWQDLAQDYDENGRIYVPQEDMQRFGVKEEQFVSKHHDPALRSLMDFEIQRAKHLILSGASLGERLTGRLGIEIRLTVLGGLAIANACHASRDDVFARPRLPRRRWLQLGIEALTGKSFHKQLVIERGINRARSATAQTSS